MEQSWKSVTKGKLHNLQIWGNYLHNLGQKWTEKKLQGKLENTLK